MCGRVLAPRMIWMSQAMESGHLARFRVEPQNYGPCLEQYVLPSQVFAAALAISVSGIPALASESQHLFDDVSRGPVANKRLNKACFALLRN